MHAMMNVACSSLSKFIHKFAYWCSRIWNSKLIGVASGSSIATVSVEWVPGCKKLSCSHSSAEDVGRCWIGSWEVVVTEVLVVRRNGVWFVGVIIARVVLIGGH